VNALEPGSTLGGYRILARLRAGAMGVLYLARRATPAGFSRPVAIKVIHDHLAQNKRFCRMFIDEAKLCARIDDPNVVRVEEFGQADGRYYLVMEYVHGASLAQTIAVLRKRGKIPIDQAVAIAMQIAGGLHGAHEATDEEGVSLGIVHRDVSPHNVVLSYKGYVRVIDFGIAKARQVGGETKTGSLRGKLAYMPPEQARSARTVDRRADLYGVGLILWEMLTFRRVFDADTDIAILNQIRDPDIIPPSVLAPAVPKALDDLVMRTLANDPAERPATGVALQRALGDAVPAALRVLPADLAALMKKVRAAADALAAGSPNDPSALYGEEVRGTLMTFGANMKESVGDADRGPRPSRPELDDGPPPEPPPPPPPLPAAMRGPLGTARPGRQAVVRSTNAPPPPPPPDKATVVMQPRVRPADGVRPVVPAPPASSPDLLIPPPPLSSSRGLAASANPGDPTRGEEPVPRSGPVSASSNLVAAAVGPSSPDPMRGSFASMPPGLAEAVPPMVSVPPPDRHRLIAPILVTAALGAALIVGIILVSQARSSTSGPSTASTMPKPRESASAKALPPPVVLQAPVVIAPPEPVADAAPDAEPKPSRKRPVAPP
jgi:hypothetical protein